MELTITPNQFVYHSVTLLLYYCCVIVLLYYCCLSELSIFSFRVLEACPCTGGRKQSASSQILVQASRPARVSCWKNMSTMSSNGKLEVCCLTSLIFRIYQIMLVSGFCHDPRVKESVVLPIAWGFETGSQQQFWGKTPALMEAFADAGHPSVPYSFGWRLLGGVDVVWLWS